MTNPRDLCDNCNQVLRVGYTGMKWVTYTSVIVKEKCDNEGFNRNVGQDYQSLPFRVYLCKECYKNNKIPKIFK